LPALLEFATLARDGHEPLAELRPSLELVRTRLHQRASRFAPLLDLLVEELPPLTRAQEERIRRLAEEGPPSELVGLDPVVSTPAGVTWAGPPSSSGSRCRISAWRSSSSGTSGVTAATSSPGRLARRSCSNRSCCASAASSSTSASSP